VDKEEDGNEMKVFDFHEQYMGFVASCTHSISNQLNPIAEERARWIRTNLAKGLKIKIAVAESQPIGFAHCLPIELGTWEIEGHDLMAIPCLTVCYDRVYNGQRSSGVGKALVEAVEDEARKTTKGVAVLGFDHDFWFMPSAFFKKLGYQEVGRQGNKVILLKAFTPVDTPSFVEFKHQPTLCPGKVVVEAFWQSICPTPIEEMHNIRKVCDEFGERVILHAINTTDPGNRSRYPVTRALFINGKRIHFDDVASPEAIREVIAVELKRIET
jgi:GNAT superfamily N-acetyltransferase